MDTTERARPAPSEVLTAVGSGALAFGGLLALPFVAAADPEEGIVPITPADAAWWIVATLVLLQAAALVGVARAPRLLLVAVALVPVVSATVVPGSTFSLTTVAVFFAVLRVVVREPMGRIAAVLPAVALLVAVAQAVNDVRSGSAPDGVTALAAALQALAVVGAPLVIGLFFAARREARDARAAELLALQRERDALVQAAVARERIAMSRELHDIAAHHMSGIALLASAMHRQVEADPDAAKRSAQQVRMQATTVLDDLRRVVGLLRHEPEDSRAVETLATIRQLVESRRAAGAEVELVLRSAHGESEVGAGIGPLAQLVAYRMVQESLANAAAHAPGARCVVEIDDRSAKRLTVRVANGGASAPDTGRGGGFGLVGMRERADLVGGELQYGATADGGWEVRLTLRRDAAGAGAIDPVTPA